MTKNQAQTLLDFMDANWTSFEGLCSEKQEDPEDIRSEIEKIAMGNNRW